MLQKYIRILLGGENIFNTNNINRYLQDEPGYQVCGVAYNGSDLIIKAGKLKPHLIITDVNLPILDGVAAIEAIKTMHPDIRVLALIQSDADQSLLRIIKAGADGCLFKATAIATLKIAVESVLVDVPYFCDAITRRLLALLKSGILVSPAQILPANFFAPNESEILELICKGKTSKEIAASLRLSYYTVIKYRQNLMEKTETHNAAELVLFAMRYGLYDPYL